MEIHAEQYNLNILIDIHRSINHADRGVFEQHTLCAEAIIVIFELDRPFRRKGPFNSCTRRPTNTVLRCIEKVNPVHVVNVVSVADQGHAAFAIDQPAVPGIADPAGYAGEKIVVDLKKAVSARLGTAKFVVLLIFPPVAAFNSHNPSRCELIITANLAPNHVPADVKTC